MRYPTAEERLAALEAFIAEHHRMPRGRVAGEASLALWHLRVLAGKVAAPAWVRERARELYRTVPRKLGRPPALPVEERIAQLRAFVAEHGRLPRERGKGSERELARWQGSMRRPDANLTPAQRAVVDALREQYRQPPALTVDERIAQLRAFVAGHGRLPRERDKDEASLAWWFGGTRRPDARLTPGQRAVLDEFRARYR